MISWFYLMYAGLEPSMAFKTMESVRKGKGLTEEMIDAMKRIMYQIGI